MFETAGKSFITYIGKEAVPEELKEWLASYNLTLSNVTEGFYSAPNGGEVPIHNDTVTKPGEHDAVKINMTWGPKDSVTRWWKVSNQDKLIEVVHNQTEVNDGFAEAGIVPDIECYKCYTADPKDLTLVHEQVIDKPSILNVGQLHSTFNPHPSEHRWTLSFTPLKDGKVIKFSDALEIFKSCLQN
jgi:hypothetical protein